MKYSKYDTLDRLWGKQVPSHWEIAPLCSIAREKSICNCSDLELLSVYLDVGVVPFVKMGTKRANATSKDTSKYQRVDPGDLVLNNQQAWRGSVGVSDYKGIVSPAYVILTLNDALSRKYANFLMRSAFMIDQFYVASKGVGSIQRNISWSDFKRSIVPIPPREEQDQIVRYLDWQVSKINKLIHGYQRQIKLLQEKDQKLTCSAVLHGLDESVAMKPSGIQNIKSIPEHWRVLQNKRIFAERTEFSETGKETLLSVSKHYGVKPYYALGDNEQFATIKPAESLVGYKRVMKNDVAMNIMRARNGSFGVSEYDGIVSPAYAVFRPIIECNPRYMHYLLRTPHVIGIFESYSYGIAEHRRRLYAVDFLRLHLPVPPVKEQNEIVQYVENIQEETRKITDKIQKEIDLLREYRTRLISDVVTGQMDVRGIEIPEYIPEEDTEDGSDTEEAADEEVMENE